MSASWVRLSAAVKRNGIIPVSHRYDSAHIALASVYELDVVVSYNFHHINREKTRRLTAAINQREGYNAVVICTAKEVLSNEYAGRLV